MTGVQGEAQARILGGRKTRSSLVAVVHSHKPSPAENVLCKVELRASGYPGSCLGLERTWSP